jgi:UDP-N-acetylglucosamine 2-epimerase
MRAANGYEMLAPASVALALRIPIAHIEGGEVSQGFSRPLESGPGNAI